MIVGAIGTLQGWSPPPFAGSALAPGSSSRMLRSSFGIRARRCAMPLHSVARHACPRQS